jgi:hypothetical protein
MTVAELIAKLSTMDPNLPVYKRYFDAGGSDGSGWDEIVNLYDVKVTKDNPWPYSLGDLPERVEIS